MKKGIKVLLYIFATFLILILVVLGYALLFLPNVGKAPYIEIELTDAKIERGRYLAYHVMMCADCHSQRDFSKFSGPPTPGTEFVGGDVFDHTMGFPGQFVSSNITPYGIGEWTDGELFRLITTGVKRDGNPIFPVMPYHKFGQLDPTDIEAVIAYLRTLDPVVSNHPDSKADFPVNIIMRTMPQDAPLTVKPNQRDQVAYGKYMATAAACFDCHTNFKNGKYVGSEGAGGREFVFPDGSILRSANITPHTTGIKNYSREDFINLFKRYADSNYTHTQVLPGDFQTLMPWYMYSGMKREDIGAIYDYLQTIEPVDQLVERFTPAQ